MVVLALASVSAIGIGLLYQFGGLKYYLQASLAITKLSGEAKNHAIDNFYWAGHSSFDYSGTLATINKKGYGGVWVWGTGGPKYFKADQYTVYSFYDPCDDSLMETLGGEGDSKKVRIGRTIDTDIKVWAQKAKPGDYVTIRIACNGCGGTPGNLREVATYGWWIFLPTNIRDTCAK